MSPNLFAPAGLAHNQPRRDQHMLRSRGVFDSMHSTNSSAGRLADHELLWSMVESGTRSDRVVHITGAHDSDIARTFSLASSTARMAPAATGSLYQNTPSGGSLKPAV
jgi:hypothetical protein